MAFDLPQLDDLPEQPAAIAMAVQDASHNMRIFCSGVPFSERLVLTAAHCIAQFKTSWPNEKLVVLAAKQPQRAYDVESWIVHPRFQPTPKHGHPDADIAIVRLKHALRPAKQSAAPAATLREGQFWMQGFSPERLSAATIEAALHSKKSWNEMQTSQVQSTDGKLNLNSQNALPSSCPGDSGAPLWQVKGNSFHLQGLVVQGNCKKGKTRALILASFDNWIISTVQALSAYAPSQMQPSSTYLFRPSAIFHRH